MRSVLETVAKGHAAPVAPAPPASLFDDFLSAPLETTPQSPPPPQVHITPVSLPPVATPPAPPVAAPPPPPLEDPPAVPQAAVPPPPLLEVETEEPQSFLQEPEPEPEPEPVPDPVADPRPAANIPDLLDEAPEFAPPHEEPPPANIGLGQMMDIQSSSRTLPVTRQAVPSLGVGLMQVEDSSRLARLRRRRLKQMVAIGIFLLADVVALLWFFRNNVKEWWQSRSAGNRTQVATTAPAVPAAK